VHVASQHTLDAWSSSSGAAVQDGSCGARGPEMMRAQRPGLMARNPSACSQMPTPVLVPHTCSRHSIGPSCPTLGSRACSSQSAGAFSTTGVVPRPFKQLRRQTGCELASVTGRYETSK